MGQTPAQKAASRLGGLTSHGTPEQAEAARLALGETRLGPHIMALAEMCPHLTPKQWHERIKAEAAADKDASPAKRARLSLLGLVPAGATDGRAAS